MQPTVIAWTPLPPPVHGASLVGARMLDGLRDRGFPVRSVDTGRRGRRGRARSGAWKVGALARALRLLVAERAGGRSVVLYLSVSGGWGRVFDVALAGVARLLGASLVLHHHSFAYLDAPDRLGAALARVAGEAARHLVLCRGMAARLGRAYPSATSVQVVSNAAWVSGPLAARPGDEHGELRVGFLGNITLEKGIEGYLDTLRRLRARGVEARGVVAGPVMEEAVGRLLEGARSEGLPLDLVGPVHGAEKEAFLGSLDVLLFPSRYGNEAAPLTVYEAAAAGVPVVATARGCLEEMEKVEGVVRHVVPRGADFAEAAADRVAAWAEGPSLGDGTRRRFRRARDEALEQLAAVLALLDGAGRVAAGEHR